MKLQAKAASIIARASAGVLACHTPSHAHSLICFAFLPTEIRAKDRQLKAHSRVRTRLNLSTFQILKQAAVLQRIQKVHGSELKIVTQHLYFNFIWNCYIVSVT